MYVLTQRVSKAHSSQTALTWQYGKNIYCQLVVLKIMLRAWGVISNLQFLLRSHLTFKLKQKLLILMNFVY